MEAKKIEKFLSDYPHLKILETNILNAFNVLQGCYKKGNKVLLCGNGGSAADCEHIVGELMKEFQIKRRISKEDEHELRMYGAGDDMIQHLVPALPAISLTSHMGFITALCNDEDANNMFAQQLYVLGNKEDVLWAISTSGNSENVIRAAITAKVKEMKVIAMTGVDGGRLKEYADVLINVPSNNTARIQEMHIPIYHMICAMLESYFFEKRDRIKR